MREIETGGRGARDAATVLPFLAAFLLAPPVILIFAAPVAVFGIPLTTIYLFGVWLVVILAAFFLSRRLADPEADRDQETRPVEDGRR
ncbi:hypothetical protein [Chelativorans sp. AA-79]|uniref:hypothetical protein n=1 Tax=Chelativorans sp. AA-79 TaxID=3028735 RepID=UPI0023F7A80A|nr:hypothetical protein [Chelativorans sp. AA-79]WEX10644.1 hypothetical protein PVE73_06720 [Chelativorans sp. AA-79]